MDFPLELDQRASGEVGESERKDDGIEVGVDD